MVNVEDVSINDDFTRIKGVGLSTQDRLKQAGYRTFEQLATAMPEDLNQINRINSQLAADIIEYARFISNKNPDMEGISSNENHNPHQNSEKKPRNIMNFIKDEEHQNNDSKHNMIYSLDLDKEKSSNKKDIQRGNNRDNR